MFNNSFLTKSLLDYNKKIIEKRNLKLENDRFKIRLKNKIKKLLIILNLLVLAKSIKKIFTKENNKDLLNELLSISSKDHKDFLPFYKVINKKPNS